MNVTAAVVERPNGPFDLQDVELGPLYADEVLIDIAAVGLCHTDLLARAGAIPTPLPAVLGHEGAGTVAAVGAAVTTVAVGDRVAMSYDSCGRCPTCMVGHAAYCDEWLPRNFGAQRLDGTSALSRHGASLHSHFFGQSSFATRAVSPERCVVKVPDDVPFDVLAPLGCGVQTGAGAVINVLKPPPGSSVAVLGVGGVGMAAVMAARAAGCTTIVAVARNPARLALALELGATHAINALEEDVVARLRELSGGGVAFSLECTGSPVVLRQAVDALAPRGVCCVLGGPPFGTTAELDVTHVLSRGVTVRGSVEGDSISAQFIPQLIELWRKGLLPVERTIQTFDFDSINDVVHQAENGLAKKPVLVVG